MDAHFELYPFQMDLLRRKKPIIAAISGTGAGKSYTGSHFLLRWLLEGPRDSHYYAVGPTLTHLRDNLWREFILRLAECGLVEGRHYAHNRSQPSSVRNLIRGTVIAARTADKPSTMQGTHVRGIVADEAGMYSVDAWHTMRQRVSMYRGQIILPTTPYSWNYLKKDVYDPWVASGKDHERIDVLQISSLANPNFPREEYEYAKTHFPRWKFDMFYRGMFTRPSGLVYGEYKLVPTKLDNIVRVFAGMDYGYNNPTAIVWIGEDAKGNRQVIRVWSKSQALTDTISEALLQHKCKIYCDPSAAGIIAELRRKGHAIAPAKNDVFAGINAVDSALRSGALSIWADAPGADHLLEELGLYSWCVDGNGEPVEKIDKSNDHACDALRYAILSGASSAPGVRAYHGGSILQSIRETARY